MFYHVCHGEAVLELFINYVSFEPWFGPRLTPEMGSSTAAKFWAASWRAQGSDGGRDHTRPEPNSYRRTSWNKWCIQDFQRKAGDIQDMARG